MKSVFVSCSTLIRKDAQDQMLVRFLPLVNDVLASLKDLDTLLHYSSCFDSSSRNSSVSSIVSTKVLNRSGKFELLLTLFARLGSISSAYSCVVEQSFYLRVPTRPSAVAGRRL